MVHRSVLNPIRQRDNYANSDFDVRHTFNANAVWQIPVGRGRWLLSNSNRVVNTILGGWQLAGIYRLESGLPIWSPYDTVWATNWEVQSSGVRIRPVESSATRGENGDAASLFGCDRVARIKAGGTRSPARPATATLSGFPATARLIWAFQNRSKCRGARTIGCRYVPRALTY